MQERRSLHRIEKKYENSTLYMFVKIGQGRQRKKRSGLLILFLEYMVRCVV